MDLYTMGCSLKLVCHNFESHSPGLEPHISYYFLGIKGNPRSANLLLESIDDGKTDVSPTSSNPQKMHKDATSLFHGSTVWWRQPGPLVHLVLLDAVWNTKSTNSASGWQGKLKTHPKGSWNGTWRIIPRIVVIFPTLVSHQFVDVCIVSKWGRPLWWSAPVPIHRILRDPGTLPSSRAVWVPLEEVAHPPWTNSGEQWGNSRIAYLTYGKSGLLMG